MGFAGRLLYDHIAGFAHEAVVAVFEGLEALTHGREQGGKFALTGAADVRRVPSFEGVFFSAGWVSPCILTFQLI